jgi:DNA mismatch repair protein MutL
MQVEFAVEPNSTASRPWQWFRYLAQTASGYILVETDAGLVTVNPQAARERIAFEQLNDGAAPPSQPLLIPEVVKLPPADAARVRAALGDVARLGFAAEEFGQDTFKVDAVPQIVGSVSPASVFATIARDLSEGAGPRRAGERWREEMVAKSVARAFAGMKFAADEASATKLVEDLCACRMPYVTPRGKPIMIFTSTRELNRKFARE